MTHLISWSRENHQNATFIWIDFCLKDILLGVHKCCHSCSSLIVFMLLLFICTRNALLYIATAVPSAPTISETTSHLSCVIYSILLGSARLYQDGRSESSTEEDEKA